MYDENANMTTTSGQEGQVDSVDGESQPSSTEEAVIIQQHQSIDSSSFPCNNIYYSPHITTTIASHHQYPQYRPPLPAGGPHHVIPQPSNQQHRLGALTNHHHHHVTNIKDPTWLLVEVCREFQRGQCSRNEQECKFAHPPAHVEIQNGRVITCFDNLKNRCKRGVTSCKFLHPPQHLKDQVSINGRNNYAWKNLLAAQVATQQHHHVTPNFAAAAQVAQVAPGNLAMAAGSFGTTLSPTAPAPIMPNGGVSAFNPYAPPYNVYQNMLLAPCTEPYGNVGGMLTQGATTANQMPVYITDNGPKMVNLRMERPNDLGQEVINKQRGCVDKVGLQIIHPWANSMNGGGTPLQCTPFGPAFPPFHTSYVPFTFTGHPINSIPRLYT